MAHIYPTVRFECSRCENEIEFVDVVLPGYASSADFHFAGQKNGTYEVECHVCRKIYLLQTVIVDGDYEARIDSAVNIDVQLDLPSKPDAFDYSEFLKSYEPTAPEFGTLIPSN